MIFFSILLIVILVVISRLAPDLLRFGEPESPLERLRRRYAEGEITTEEYDESVLRL